MPEFTVALETLGARQGAGTASAYERLGEALGTDRLGDIDEAGIVEARVVADDFDGALKQVWNAVATAGADDHFVFAEHPDLPEHWRRREGGGPPPGALG
jgi:hypothetical protein